MAPQIPVLIVGGSLNGLSTALFLARRGVRSVVVERHPSTTKQYKFAGISARSMEIYREAGIEGEIRRNRTGDQQSGEIARARNLSDSDVEFWDKPWANTLHLSAATPATCDQDRLEPILRAHAERLGADVRFHTELIDFEQDEHEIRGRVRDIETGREETIRARYLIAADGVNGRTREGLDIERHGPGVLQHWMNLIFETDLEPYLKGRRFTSCFVTDVNGSITPREDRWLLAVPYRPDQERTSDFDQTRTADLVKKAAGRADVRVELFDARAWVVAGLIAERFRSGRTFLVGDAAHSIPPTGGFGGNTGIHDAHNLAWKLAAVLDGTASPELLDTYDSERRVVARRTLDQALARLAAWFEGSQSAPVSSEPVLDDRAVVFGQVYQTGALIPDDGGTDGSFEDPQQPTGRPGTRAPHLILEEPGGPVPIHDLFGPGFTLLAGPAGWAWREAGERLQSGIELRCTEVGGDGHGAQVARRFEAAYGIQPEGAVLVRPDGFIAWRSKGSVAEPVATLRSAFERLFIRVS